HRPLRVLLQGPVGAGDRRHLEDPERAAGRGDPDGPAAPGRAGRPHRAAALDRDRQRHAGQDVRAVPAQGHDRARRGRRHRRLRPERPTGAVGADAPHERRLLLLRGPHGHRQGRDGALPRSGDRRQGRVPRQPRSRPVRAPRHLRIPPMSIDVGLVLQTDPPAQTVVELMVRAEELGFSHGWTFDSHVLWQEPYVIYPRILERTQRLVVGPMVTNPATRDWTVIASMHAALNEQFGNRTICGIGRGHSPGRVQGRPPTTLARLEQSLHPIRGRAEGRAVERHGAPVRTPWVTEATKLPVWMAGYGPKALDLVGRAADGCILHLADPYLVEWTVKTVRSSAEAAGRDPAAITICVAAPAYGGDDPGHARDPCRGFGGAVGN